MFDIGWQELFFVAVIAVIVIGPKDLPRVVAQIGRFAGKARSMAREFQDGLREVVREAELDELRQSVEKEAGLGIKDELDNLIEPEGDFDPAAFDAEIGQAMEPPSPPDPIPAPETPPETDAKPKKRAAPKRKTAAKKTTPAKPAAKAAAAKTGEPTKKTATRKAPAAKSKAASAKTSSARTSGAKTGAAKPKAAPKARAPRRTKVSDETKQDG